MQTQFLKVLAESCRECFEKMTGTKVESVNLRKDQRLANRYDLAMSVDFEDKTGRWQGRFVMGFEDGQIGLLVASALAESMGLGEIHTLDEDCYDVLGEFLNTVAGQTTTGWDALGFSADFGPPHIIRSQSLACFNGPLTESYVVILNLAFGAMVFSVSWSDGQAKPVGQRALVVDDSKVVRGILRKALEVAQAADGVEAKEVHGWFKPHITIMDLVMPKKGGLDAMVEILEKEPDARFIVLSSIAKREDRVTAGTLGVCKYLTKPVKMEDLIASVQEALAGECDAPADIEAG